MVHYKNYDQNQHVSDDDHDLYDSDDYGDTWDSFSNDSFSSYERNPFDVSYDSSDSEGPLFIPSSEAPIRRYHFDPAPEIPASMFELSVLPRPYPRASKEEIASISHPSSDSEDKEIKEKEPTFAWNSIAVETTTLSSIVSQQELEKKEMEKIKQEREMRKQQQQLQQQQRRRERDYDRRHAHHHRRSQNHQDHHYSSNPSNKRSLLLSSKHSEADKDGFVTVSYQKKQVKEDMKDNTVDISSPRGMKHQELSHEAPSRPSKHVPHPKHTSKQSPPPSQRGHGASSMATSSSAYRYDLLCIHTKDHDHHCRFAHSFDEWMPKKCKYSQSCSKGNSCSYWHQGKETKHEYLVRSLRLDVSFFKKHKTQYVHTYRLKL